MTDREDIDAIAAEFVLGTLDGGERTVVAARRQREPALDAAINAWERRLSPLSLAVPPVDPPRDVWAKIEAKLDTKPSAGSQAIAASNVIALEQRVTRWRRLAIAASAIAASLLAVVSVREMQRAATPRNYVAVFQKDDALPAFLLTIDLDSRLLTIRSVAAETPPGKSYQLWIATGQSGGKPSSLGLVDGRGVPTATTLTAYDPAIVQAATFGVSLEPSGGSPTGQPTGPVFHAKLIQAR
jgi:anti-sigma-K factor RskA